MITMSMPSASPRFSGEEVRVVQRRTGRTFANTSSSARSASRPISGRTSPVSHRGPPTAPFSTASACLTAVRTWGGNGSPCVSMAFPPNGYCAVSYEKPKAVAATSSTRRVSRIVSGPMPSPGSTAIL